MSHISKSFGGKKVLDDVSFSVRTGVVCGLFGENGAGKTTVYRLLSGLCLTYFFEDFEEKRTAYLPEERGLLPEMSVVKFLLYVAKLRGAKSEVLPEVRCLLGDCGMAEYADVRIAKLSKGLQQKVQLLSVLVPMPEVLLLDEPFSGMDAGNVRFFADFLRNLSHEKGVSVLLSAHEPNVLDALCDDVLMLRGGKIAFSGTVAEAKKRFFAENLYLVRSDAELRNCAAFRVQKSERKTAFVESQICCGENFSANELLGELTKQAEIHFFGKKEWSLAEIFEKTK